MILTTKDHVLRMSLYRLGLSDLENADRLSAALDGRLS